MMQQHGLMDLAKDHQREIREIARRSRGERGGQSLVARIAKRANRLYGALLTLVA